MTRVLQGQQDSFLLRWAWDPSGTILSGLATHRGELVSTGEGHPDSPSRFSDSLMVLLIFGCALSLKFCKEAWTHVFQNTQKVFWKIPPGRSFIKIMNYF